MSRYRFDLAPPADDGDLLQGADPLLSALRAYRATRYVTLLYLVCWADGEALRARLDGRVPYLELGSL
jgi:hypothetical protein